MYITRLNIRNFKSIETANVSFEPFTMIVGANAVGKSNLINVFRFIQNIIVYGLDHAVALQGGIKHIACANLPKGEKIEISFEIVFNNSIWIRRVYDTKYALSAKSIDYKFVIQPNKRGSGYHVIYDYFRIGYDCFSYDPSANKSEKYTDLKSQFYTTFERKSRHSKIYTSYDLYPDSSDVKLKDIKADNSTRFFSYHCSDDTNNLMLYKIELLLPPEFSANTFIRIFDFDPKALKKSSSVASIGILDENGANIASILKSILSSKENSKKLTLLLQDFLPFVKSISVENNPDKSFSYKIKESYNSTSFYSNFMSDGTVSLIALIIALYFEESSNVIILEEPERNIHPHLLAKLLDSVKDVSMEKQIIITTHNPEIFRHVDLSNVRLVSRNRHGSTIVSEPGRSKIVKEFIKNDLGLDDLMVQGLLGD